VTLFFSITTLFLSIAVVVIAVLQWRVADNKLRLDLFDRRYKVYNAARDFLAQIARNTSFDDSRLFEFNAGTSDAGFLFRADVVEHLGEIRRRALNLRTTRKLSEKPQLSDDEVSRYAQADSEDVKWLGDQMTRITKVFDPYLGFANVRLRAMPRLKDWLLGEGSEP
jgi:hypothetical protein